MAYRNASTAHDQCRVLRSVGPFPYCQQAGRVTTTRTGSLLSGLIPDTALSPAPSLSFKLLTALPLSGSSPNWIHLKYPVQMNFCIWLTYFFSYFRIAKSPCWLLRCINLHNANDNRKRKKGRNKQTKQQQNKNALITVLPVELGH